MLNVYNYRDYMRVQISRFAADAVDHGQTERKQTSPVYSTCNTAKFINAQRDTVKL